MRKRIRTSTGKFIELPARMFRLSDLVDMRVDFVEEKILLNMAKPGEPFRQVPVEVLGRMALLNYTDFSQVPFSMNRLLLSVEAQLGSPSDFVILPAFKGENAPDTRQKIRLAAELKMRTGKDIILEIPYKSSISTVELANEEGSFDYLSIFYGNHWGGFPSFKSICTRILEFKVATRKPVFCMGVQVKFPGDTTRDVRFMPCYDIISDGWIKCWRRGGGGDEIKVVDPQDLKSKTYAGWLESGYHPWTLLPQIGRSVLELFSDHDKADREARELFERLIADEVMREISTLTPQTVEPYASRYFYPLYLWLIFPIYREKLVIDGLLNSELFVQFSEEDKSLLAGNVREQPSIERAYERIQRFRELVLKDQTLSAPELVALIDGERHQE